MTAAQELRALWRLFPRSEDLAVSREMLERYACEMIADHRFINPTPTISWGGIERYPGLQVQRTSLWFRDRVLTVVEAR